MVNILNLRLLVLLGPDYPRLQRDCVSLTCAVLGTLSVADSVLCSVPVSWESQGKCSLLLLLTVGI